jgi:hypothetical protein
LVRQVTLLGIAVVLIAAGCGGKTTYTATKTRECLAGHGIGIAHEPRTDLVASTATGGAFVVRTNGNHVTMVFGQADDDADQIQQAYERFAFSNVKAGLPDVLRRDKNVIMLWHEHPSDADLDVVLSCLS